MNKELKFFVVFVLFVLIGAGIAVFIFKPEWLPFKAKSREEKVSSIGSSGYQAVFLTNGQVYFGRLAKRESDYPVLTQVYYLRLQQPLQEQKEEKKEKEPEPASLQQNLTLIKLGNELHGPSDEITLNKDHILFIENLREDSRIVKAIKEYETIQAE